MEYYSLVTGASSGIGKSLAFELAARNYNVLLVSLPNQGLKEVSEHLRDTYHIKSDWFEIDLSLPDGPQKVFEWTIHNNYTVTNLVNNAGIAGTMGIDKADTAYVDDRILVNIRALTLLCHYFVPSMKYLPKAHILNVASLSAFYAIPFKSVYAASKAFVVSFSRAIRTELKDTGISVSVVCPNGVRTNEGTDARIDAHGNIVKLTTITSEQVAKKAINGMIRRKFMIIPGYFNIFLLFLSRMIPVFIKQHLLYREFFKEIQPTVISLEPVSEPRSQLD